MNAIRYENAPGIGRAMLKPSQIRTDGGTQSRAGIASDVVSEYAEAIGAGAVFPLIVVFFDGSDYWLGDGFHRYHAHVAAGSKKIEADVRQGSHRDAILYSVGANAVHGLRRTNDDKRRAVSTLLEDEEWRCWNDVKIAEKCGVSSMFVGKVRKELSLNGLMMSAQRTVERGGTVYQQDTAAIGKLPQSEEISAAPADGGSQTAGPLNREEVSTVAEDLSVRPQSEDDDEITAEDLANDPGFQKAVEAMNNAKVLYDEVMAMPPAEPMTPERKARLERAFGTDDNRAHFMNIVNAVRLIDDLPAPDDMVRAVPPTLQHAVDVLAILKTAQWLETFARAWKRKGEAA